MVKEVLNSEREIIINGFVVKQRLKVFESRECWVCGKQMKKYGKLDNNKGTMHHVIPKSLNPISNIIIPVCWKCHKEIHNINKE
jgi:5-methylcytosine-specific restriction endonuclease McrA